MIRSLITPQNQNVSILISKNYAGKKVECIAFIVDESKVDTTIKETIFTHFASENVLSRDWLSQTEDLAWKAL